MTDRICFPTLDPRLGGGIRSVTRLAYGVASEGVYDPYIAFNSISDQENLTFSRLLSLDTTITYDRGTYDEMEGIKIGRVLPEIKAFNYLLNRNQWTDALAEADKCLGLGAHCLPCLPAAVDDMNFGCWIGTSIYDEIKSQAGNFHSIRDIRERAILPLLTRYERFILRRAEVIYSQSSTTKDRIETLHGISPDKVRIIPYPIDTETYCPGEDTNDTGILFVGRINDPRKNIEFLLRAFERVLAELPQATLTLVGGNPNERLRRRMDELDIASATRCVGEVPDVVPYLRQATVFVLPSEQEGLGIAGLEAQSCGTPVVATRCGGPEDYVSDGKNGFLVPRGDTEQLADRLIQVLRDEALRTEFATQSRKTVVENFSEEVIRNEIDRVIEQLPVL